MNTKMNNLLTPTAAAASLLLLGSCGEDKEPTASDNSDLLIGEWEVYSVDGEVYVEEDETSSYSLAMKFEADGDFAFCYDYESKVNPSDSYVECYEGDWQWITKGEELTFSFESEEETNDGTIVTVEAEIDLKITKLTATELEGDWTNEDEGETYEIVLRKN